MIFLQCNCGTTLKVKPENAGKPVRCPKCKEVTYAPSEPGIPLPPPAADDSAALADPPSVNMPRLRSEALRAATPVTNVQAGTLSDVPVVKTVAATAAKVAPVSIPTPPLPQVAEGPIEPPPAIVAPASPRKQRVPPPLPPSANSHPDPLLGELPPLEPQRSVSTPRTLAATKPQQSPGGTTASKSASAPLARRPLTWWAGGAIALLCLIVVAFLLGRGGREEALPSEEEVTPAVANAAKENPRQVDEPAPQESEDKPARTAQSRPRQPSARPLPAVATSNAQPAVAEPSPGPIAKTPPPSRVVAPPRTGPGGLTGVSRQYDDLDCMRIQAQHSIRVPSAAAVLEVDGQRLPLANLAVLAECPAPYLYLPRGTHAVKFRRNETPVSVTIQSDLSQIYHEMRAFFDAGGNVREVELISRGAKAMDVHSAPFLLNLMGGVHLNKQQPEAAQRKFRRALRVNPLFAPAHLNLAAMLADRGDVKQAKQELLLAEATNVGNCFGLTPAIAAVRRNLKLPPAELPAADIELASYVTEESLSEEDQRITALMLGLSKYAIQDADRGKIINNLAVHFAETGRTELALDHFRSALGVLKSAGPERYKLAQQVLSHMSQACRTAGYDEADDYERMRGLVTP